MYSRPISSILVVTMTPQFCLEQVVSGRSIGLKNTPKNLITQMNKFTADDGENLSVKISGSGHPIVMLHGWTSNHAGWGSIPQALSPNHRVFSPDARGHGMQVLSKNQEPDVKRLARDVLNLLDHYGLEKAAMVGHSMGALTLWQFIRDFGCKRFSHLCIIDQSPKLVTDESWQNGIYGNFDAARSQLMLAELDSNFVETVLKLIAYGLNSKARVSYDRDSYGWELARKNLLPLDPQPLIAIWKSLVAADYRDVLSLINVPTLLVWGKESNFYTEATAKYLLTHIKLATSSSYENADHCPQLKDPLRFSTELLKFFACPTAPA